VSLVIRATLSDFTQAAGKQVVVTAPRYGVSELVEIHRIAQRYSRMAISLRSEDRSGQNLRYASLTLETNEGILIHQTDNPHIPSHQLCLQNLSLESQPSSILPPTSKEPSAPNSTRLVPSGAPKKETSPDASPPCPPSGLPPECTGRLSSRSVTTKRRKRNRKNRDNAGADEPEE
jgi:hypothetical protein